MLSIEKVETVISPEPDAKVQLKKMGDIYEVRTMEREQKPPILKISKDYYICLAEDTGEVKEFTHHSNRAESPFSVAQTLRKLRDLLNANVTDTDNCLWITLTYRENMRDTARLYNDFRKFNQRLRYYLGKEKRPPYQYIVTMEPQGRGAWHAHAVLIFPHKAPFIPNEKLAEIWGHGFVSVRSLRDVDNVGVYLTAYLGNMELSEALRNGATRADSIAQVETVDKDGKRQSKAILKGARLRLYPAGFKLYRHSRGVKYPEKRECTEQEALQEIGTAKLTFQKTLRLIDGEKVINTITYRHYNRKAKGAGCDDGE